MENVSYIIFVRILQFQAFRRLTTSASRRILVFNPDYSYKSTKICYALWFTSIHINH